MNNIDNILDTAFCKIKDSPKNLHRWKSWEPTTPFAPIFDVPIMLSNVDSTIVDEVADLIIQSDIGMYRKLWQDYNIFKWEEHTCLKNLLVCIAKSYNDYMDVLGFPKEDESTLWIRGWAVALNPGEDVSRHCHSYHENTFISGNIFLRGHETTTDYIIPHLTSYYGPWRCQNVPGRMSLFPSWVEHSVDPVSEKRYSMAFDLFTSSTMSYISDNKVSGDKAQETILHSIPLSGKP